MQDLEDLDDPSAVLRSLSEAGLIDIIIGEGGEARFTLCAAITEAGPDRIAALLAGIEAIAHPRHGA
jgi:hypothetical protein